ncbi:NlpC/P60 family protein [Sphingobacterium oryzagri]|uniref:NlpC/P60 family protein n=1 Tax=Sphingobacterium oryzagri TaxID=3025669 RepID=A0ABY7WCM1_9SPHI|nr:NlpC/P60 family protein [Sphingobacterium sp. KACC 22765]WDF67399.1 NlpC/P60 family protein [Sphingobacterium sp. KACC 22765]
MATPIRLISTILLLLTQNLSGTFAQSDTASAEKFKQLLEEARLELAPDKRTSIVEQVPSADNPQKYIVQISDSRIKTALEKKLKDYANQLTILTLPDASVGEQAYGVVQLSVANLRTKPSHAAEMATQVLLGTVLDILQKDGADLRVRTPEGYIAWIQRSSLTLMDEDAVSAWKNAKRIMYTNDFGKSYSAPDANSQRISDLVYGDMLALVAEHEQFYQVAYPDGRTGYVAKEEALPFSDWLNSRQANAQTILQSAKTMLGLPYLWGGTSVKAVDCSGFTKTSFFMNGYIIPRDASQQALYGQSIDILDKNGDFDPAKALKNLRPADLLFFAGGKKPGSQARVTHVALYLGDGEFIHAAGTVRINSMLKAAANYDDFQTRTVVAAKRYLGVQDSAITKVADSPYYQTTN